MPPCCIIVPNKNILFFSKKSCPCKSIAATFSISRPTPNPASLYEDDFIKAVIGHSQETAEQEQRLKEKELKTLLSRDDELDGLFERIYEDICCKG